MAVRSGSPQRRNSCKYFEDATSGDGPSVAPGTIEVMIGSPASMEKSVRIIRVK